LPDWAALSTNYVEGHLSLILSFSPGEFEAHCALKQASARRRFNAVPTEALALVLDAFP
jgi:hypothetical protein